MRTIFLFIILITSLRSNSQITVEYEFKDSIAIHHVLFFNYITSDTVYTSSTARGKFIVNNYYQCPALGIVVDNQWNSMITVDAEEDIHLWLYSANDLWFASINKEGFNQRHNFVQQTIQELKAQRNNAMVQYYQSASDQIKKQYHEKWKQMTDEIDSTWRAFFLDNPNSFLSVEYLYTMITSKAVSLDSLKWYYAKIPNRYSVFTQYNLCGRLLNEPNYGLNTYDVLPDSICRFLFAPLLNSYGRKIIFFGATWCKSCHITAVKIGNAKIQKSYRSVQMAAVNLDRDSSSYRRWVKELPFEADSYISASANHEFLVRLQVTSIPKIILVDEQNKIRYSGNDVAALLKLLQ